jgi:hypothetical protein
MRKIDFCDALGDINEDYIREAQAFRNQEFFETAKTKVTSRRKRSIALIAACVCLMISFITALAVSGLGTQIIEFFTDRRLGTDYSESGYDLSVFIEKFPVEALKGDVCKVGALIVHQYEEYQPYSSRFPGHWQKSFKSRGDACDYIGVDCLKRLDLDVTEQETKMNVYGYANGAIQFFILETIYTEGDIQLQFFSQIYTENYTEEITTGTRTTESVEFDKSFYTTVNNLYHSQQ